MSDYFFDKFNENDNKSMQISKILDPEPNIQKSDELLFDKFKIRGEKFGIFEDRYILLTKTHLHIYENQDKTGYKGSFVLPYMRNEFFLDDSTTNKKYGIKFAQHFLHEDYITSDKEVYNKWSSALSKICIQTDFHSKYQTISQIGEGKFAAVFKVKNNTTGEFRAVKAFTKADYLTDEFTNSTLINEINLMREFGYHPNVVHLHEVHETKNS